MEILKYFKIGSKVHSLFWDLLNLIRMHILLFNCQRSIHASLVLQKLFFRSNKIFFQIFFFFHILSGSSMTTSMIQNFNIIKGKRRTKVNDWWLNDWLQILKNPLLFAIALGCYKQTSKESYNNPGRLEDVNVSGKI